jgi:hypothetical protein
MDAHELYYNFILGKDVVATPDIRDEHILKLLSLMGTTPTEPKTAESKESPVESKESPMEESPSTVEIEPPGANVEDAFQKLSLKKDVLFHCDTIMAQRSRQRLDALVRHIDCIVNMSWVYSFASIVQSDTEIELDRYENLNKESQRHIHIISNDILFFLRCLNDTERGKITTFAWSIGSKKAIHLQKFKEKMELRFKTSAVLSTTVVASIGLPLHEIIKVVEYLKFIRRKNNILSNENIVKVVLRKKIKIEKISTALEQNQLIEAYEERENVFDVNETYSDVHMYMFKHWYSYPTADELRHIFERAEHNVALWIKS